MATRMAPRKTWPSVDSFLLGSKIGNTFFTRIILTLTLICCFRIVEAASREVVKTPPDKLLKRQISVTSNHLSRGLFNCPDGWTLNQDRCFKLTSIELTWIQAQRQCESYDSTLAHTNNIKDSTWLNYFVIQYYANQTELVEQASSILKELNISVWIGIVRLSNGSLVRIGSPSEEGRNIQSYKQLLAADKAKSTRFICYGLRSRAANGTQFFGHMMDCDERKASVCMINACDVTRVRCLHQGKCISRQKVCDGFVDCRHGSDEKQCDGGPRDLSTPAVDSSPVCGALYRNDEGKLWFPRLHDNYLPFSQCVWTIETDPSLHIIITIESLDIEEKYDTLKIYDGGMISDFSLLASFDGMRYNETVHTTGSFATVQFLSDGSVQRKGFNISWSSDPLSSVCGDTFDVDDIGTGQIKFDQSTGPHMAHILGHTTCDWTVYSNSYQGHISLQVKDLHLDTGDTFQVIDGSHPNGLVVYSLNSTQSQHFGSEEFSVFQMWPPELFAGGNFMPVMIVSSLHSLSIRLTRWKNSSSRFEASFQKGCDMITSSPILLQSPGMTSGRYPNDLNCSWKISDMSLHHPLTMLMSSKFQTESAKDILQVSTYNAENKNAVVIAELSGSDERDLFSVSSYYGFYLHFQTDSTVNSGHWSAIISFDCDVQETSNGVRLSTESVSFGVHVDYSCPEGYQLKGPSRAVCGINGRWNPVKSPVCEDATCEVPLEVCNGYLVSMSGQGYLDQAIYRCHHGFIPSGNTTSICGVNGWSEGLTCQEILCPKQPPPPEGNAIAEDIRFGYMREYFCKAGFKLVGSKFSHCGIDGLWSDEVPRCDAQKCPPIEKPLNGKWNSSNPLAVGERVMIVCDKGYECRGSQFLSCKEGFLYDQKIPTCIDVNECLIPDICGSHRCQNYIGHFNCFCSKGYQKSHDHKCVDIDECLQDNGGCSHICLNTPGSFVCQCPKELRLYSEPETHVGNRTIMPLKSCIDVCEPFSVSNGSVIYNRRLLSSGFFLDGTTAIVTCPAGSSPDGKANVVCLVGQGWSSRVTQCIESRCSEPMKIWNGNVTVTSLKVGGMAMYACREGFKLNGFSMRFCISTPAQYSAQGHHISWNEETPFCEAILCPNLKSPSHGEVVMTKIGFKSVAVFQCDCGFHLAGQSFLWCTVNGSWSYPKPSCEVKSCRHPGIPKNADIVKFSRGFPVGSFLTYQCSRQGYQISDSRPLRCIPSTMFKISTSKPFFQASLHMSFTTSNERSVSSLCYTAYENHISQSVVRWVGDIIQSECSEINLNIEVNADTMIEMMNNKIRADSNVTVSTLNALLPSMCRDTIQSHLSSNLSTFDDMVNEFYGYEASCLQAHLDFEAVTISNGDWGCWSGLSLEFHDGKKEPLCVEYCIEKNLGKIDHVQTLGQSSTEDRASFSQLDQTGKRTSMPFDRFAFPTTLSSSQADVRHNNPELKNLSVTKKDNSNPLFTMANQNPTDKAIEQPDLSLDNLSSQRTVDGSDKVNSTYSSREEFFHSTLPPFHQRRDSAFNDSLLQATKDQTFYRNEDEMFSLHGQDSFPQRIRNPNCGRREINSHDFGRLSSGGGERKMSSSADLFNVHSHGSQSDCLTTHSLENQETKIGHEMTVPKVNMTAPFYNIELHDRMKGSFSNITCVDAVHVLVNAKVNGILRLFGQQIGSLVCINAPDSSLELLAGNIRFKNTRARLFIKFAVGNTVSSKSNVESCGREFESFIAHQLPESLASVGPEVYGNSCRFINYTSQDFKLSNTGWGCHSGYTLHTALFHCTQLSAFDKWSGKSDSSTFTSVTSVPRLPMHFTGAFGLVHIEERITAVCISEYRSGIILAMEEIETHLQSSFFQCANIYIDLKSNISVSLSGKRVIAHATVHLIPLKTSLSMKIITKCYRFLSLYFREPSHILPAVSLGRRYIPTCPEIFLIPHSLRASPNIAFFCPRGLIYDEQNFKCFDKSAASYTTGVEVSLQGNFKGRVCSEKVNQFAIQMAKEALSEIRMNLKQGAICNGLNDLLLLEKSASIELKSNNVTVLIPVSLISLNRSRHQTRSCMLDVVHHINSALERPISSLLMKASHICNKPSPRMTQLHKVVFSRWECNPPLIYNHNTGICDDETLQSQNLQMKGLSASRKKRQTNLENVFVNGTTKEPLWDNIIPYCHDIEPPVFQSCPKQSLTIVLDHLAPKPVFVPLPSATDNSGIKPRIMFTQPPDFHLPYLFRQNMTIVMRSVDDSNNSAVCNININVIDQVPPVITCPTQIVHIQELSSMPFNERTVYRYCHRAVQIYDNSQDVKVRFELVQDKNTTLQGTVMVNALAVDGHRNTANCHFFVNVESRCSESNLLNPVNGFKRCVPSGRDRQSLVCAISCQEGMAFAVKPPLQYVCSSRNNKWIPHNRAPSCHKKEFSNFELGLISRYNFGDNSRPGCLRKTFEAVENSTNLLISTLCRNALHHLKVSVNGSDTITNHLGSSSVSHNIKVQLLTFHGTKPSAPPALWCGNQLLPALELTVNESFARHCTNAALITLSSNHISGKKACDKGFALIDSFCVECSRGTFWVNSQCLECPKGTFQTQPRQEKCHPCSKNFSTLYAGAKSSDACLALCPVNSYSGNGLEPCIQCPVGTFQANRGSRYCEKCVANSSLPRSFCRDLCPAGYVSSTGSLPCSPCPLNFYSSKIAMKHCLPCPLGRMSIHQGTDSIDKCIEYKPCEHNPCMNGGLCKVMGNEMFCECVSDYTGPHCDVVKDKCESQPCLNGGLCERTGHSFQCHCKPGFTGLHCEHVIDYCLSNPCVHGLCNNLPDGYQCLCFSGYEGNKCHINTDDCLDVTCQNNGTCMDELNHFHCQCRAGYEGTLCEGRIDNCLTNYCINGGTCADGISTFSCTCPKDFHGNFCEQKVDNCFSSPCRNNGACLDHGTGHLCICPVGFTGKLCEIETDFCKSQPCHNNATCTQIDQQNLEGFKCHCLKGFYGVRCQYTEDTCASMTCHLDGTGKCENQGSHHHCHCLPGWTGKLCEVKLDPCDENPCQNSGMCVNYDHSFECKCNHGFIGVFCQTPPDSCLDELCQNKGRCIQTNTSSHHICLCPLGFSGTWCEININECQNLPCHNGGTCEDGVNSFSCSCMQGFAGPTCEIDIDECIGQPCGKNRICKQLDGDFQCSCPPGTTSQNCEYDLNVCKLNPCQNRGECTTGENGSFVCHCAVGFTGKTCSQIAADECRKHIRCLNGGSCYRKEEKFACLCTTMFAGRHCEKEKSPNFDIHFRGNGSFCQGQSLPLGNVTTLSLCLWVQFDEIGHSGTFLSLLSEGQHAMIPLLVMNGLQIDLPFTGRLPSIVNINDGSWHHICVLIDPHQWQIFQDGAMLFHGTNAATGLSLSTSLQLTLGQPVLEDEDVHEFRGSITNLIISSQVFEWQLIQQMSRDCSNLNMNGDIFNWVKITAYNMKNSLVKKPSKCQQNCVNEDQKCDGIKLKERKSDPQVTFCPKDMEITSPSSPVPVSWKEPVFEDDEGVVALEQNYRSGQAFSYGMYLVMYLVLDVDDNSAVCKFHIFVRRFSCKDPAPPLNGARVCGEWSHGRYCIPSCLPNFMFVTPVPPFYHCGRDGYWEPDGLQKQQLNFPTCARVHPPSYIIFGGIQFDGPTCNPSFVKSLHTRLVNVLTQVDSIIGLCESENPCNYTQGLTSTCGEQRDFRLKREVKSFDTYTAHINFSLSHGIRVENEKHIEWISEKIAMALKSAPSLDQFPLQSLDFHTEVACMEGTVLKRDNFGQYRCMECPVDHFIDQTSTCSPCARGWYNDVPGATFCKKCFREEDTPISLNCQGVCDVGHYFSSAETICKMCHQGQYQNESGQWLCKTCSMGLTTVMEGSSSETSCIDICHDGEELGKDKCILCPSGWFRNHSVSLMCQPCPYGWTTPHKGALSVSQCIIKKCEPGHFRIEDENACYPCPRGTFQSLKGQFFCIPCGIRYTTAFKGAHSRTLCYQGEVDECILGIDNCSNNSHCVDTKDGFTCECKFGEPDNGQCKTLEEVTRKCKTRGLKSGEFGNEQQCQCDPLLCKVKDSPSALKYLLIPALTITAASCMIVSLALLGIYIWKKRVNHSPPVRLYRKEKKLKAFSNDVFEKEQSQVNSHSFDSSSIVTLSSNISVHLQKHCSAFFDDTNEEGFTYRL